jgi:hypothetical protein
MNKPRVFVGSSSEEAEYARAIVDVLSENADAVFWKDTDTYLSEYTLSNLLEQLSRSDLAIFVLSPDDLVRSRGTDTTKPRDNVVFELGLFMGRLGLERTFMVLRDGPQVALPSDLLGIQVAHYRPIQSDYRASVGPACTRLRRHIERIDTLPTPYARMADFAHLVDRLRNCLSNPGYPTGRTLKVLAAAAGQPETDAGLERTRELLLLVPARRVRRESGKEEMWTSREI